MIPRQCKRLIEVDFPIAAVSRHAVREKSIRHGHPSTLHLWWARRPLAACRAVLMGLLLPDPCDEYCPAEFKEEARRLLSDLRGRPQRWETLLGSDEGLRKVLLEFIGDFANWDNASRPDYLVAGRGLVKAAHPEETPLVVDPFAGGGSIPLEALRLGCEAFASDLNPVACLILKVMLEDIPRHGPGLADELRRVGNEIKEQAERELAELYPPDPDGARPIAYLWARTVRCEAPNCGAEIPLVRSFWLCKKASRRRALRYRVERPKGEPPRVELEIFEPVAERDVSPGTVSQAKARCPACNTVLPSERVRAQLGSQRGGADVVFDAGSRRTGGARLLAVVSLREGEPGRHYRLSAPHDYAVVHGAHSRLVGKLEGWERGGRQGLCTVPDEEIPLTELRRINVPLYGVSRFRELFTSRQLCTLTFLADRIGQVSAAGVARLLGLVLGKTCDLNNANTPWKPDAECPVHTLARHDLPMAWDFAEAVPIGEASGSFFSAFERSASAVLAASVKADNIASVEPADACHHPLPSQSSAAWFTDPPYYDAVPYAHLSDFFHVWLRRAVATYLRGTTPVTPKATECVVDRPHRLIPQAKGRALFEERIAAAMAEGARTTAQDGIGCVVFAHKTTEGWEALLSGVVHGGWSVVASWPVTTEMGSRLNARNNASLAASVHLVVRPRRGEAFGDWQAVAHELPLRVREWMERLQSEGIHGADLVFACIGPALEIYSRYAKVVDAEDRPIPLGGDPEAKEPHLRGYLAYVWETVARIALEQVLGGNGRGAAYEEDARLTALFLWTLQSTEANGDPSPRPSPRTRGEGAEAEEGAEDAGGDEEDEAPKAKKRGFTLIFDVARRFAQPLGIHLDAWEHRIIETEKGVVRLLPVTERAKQLFGEEGADGVAAELEQAPARGGVQLKLFPDEEPEPVRVRGRRVARAGVGDDALQTRREATTLDRVHAAMLLQRAGRANALRALLEAEQERGGEFQRLANSLSALYPRESEEKRLLDAMLLAMPR